MFRSGRVYQSQDGPDTTSVSHSNGIDENRKKNTNDDPAQPLTGLPRLDSVADRCRQEPQGGDKLSDTSDDSEPADDSSFLSRCFCCCRRRAETKVVGETAS